MPESKNTEQFMFKTKKIQKTYLKHLKRIDDLLLLYRLYPFLSALCLAAPTSGQLRLLFDGKRYWPIWNKKKLKLIACINTSRTEDKKKILITPKEIINHETKDNLKVKANEMKI